MSSLRRREPPKDLRAVKGIALLGILHCVQDDKERDGTRRRTQDDRKGLKYEARITEYETNTKLRKFEIRIPKFETNTNGGKGNKRETRNTKYEWRNKYEI